MARNRLAAAKQQASCSYKNPDNLKVKMEFYCHKLGEKQGGSFQIRKKNKNKNKTCLIGHSGPTRRGEREGFILFPSLTISRPKGHGNWQDAGVALRPTPTGPSTPLISLFQLQSLSLHFPLFLSLTRSLSLSTFKRCRDMIGAIGTSSTSTCQTYNFRGCRRGGSQPCQP